MYDMPVLNNVDKIVVKILLHADTPCMNANTGRHLSIPSCHICINTINASIYALHGVYFLQSLFVDDNRGAPKGRWRGNKWRIFSLLNGALEGL